VKQFSIKDFIFYNNPCINCRSNNNLYLVCVNYNPIDGTESGIRVKPPTLQEQKYLVFDLEIKYKSINKLYIDYKTNQFLSNDIEAFYNYIKHNLMFFRSSCDCGTTIDSSKLKVNAEKQFILPLTIDHEDIKISINDSVHRFQSDYYNNSSQLYINSFDKAQNIVNGLPLMPLYSFKNRQEFINKIKTIINFS
jgi:hypothetical protein